MAKILKVDIDTTASIAKLKELKQKLKETAAGSADFKKTSADIRDMEDALEGAKLGAEDFAGQLEAAPGPVGKLFSAIKKVEIATKSWGAALKATGIGLIVAAVGGLVGAFTQTEGAMKKLEPLLIGFEKIFGGIFEAVQPLLDAFLEMATNALPYITNGIGGFYSVLLGLFNLIKNVGVGAGKILKGIFTLDFDALKEGYNQIKDAIPNAIDAGVKAFGRYEAGTKKLTKTEKENLKEREKDNKDALAEAKRILDEKIKLLETEDKLDEAKLNKLKAEALALATTEQEKLDIEIKFSELSYNAAVKDIEAKQALYKKDSIEYKALQTEKINAESDFINKKTGFAETQKKINEDIAKKEEERLEKEREQRLKEDAKIKGEDDARYLRLMAGAQLDLDLQRNLLEQKKANDAAYYATQLANEKLTAEQIRELNDRKLADQIFYTEKSNEIERNRIAVKQKALDDIISIAGAETNVGRAALVAKQILNAKELILEVSRTITFSAQAAARSTVAVAEGTAQTAKVGFPQNIPLLIGYAAQAVGIIMAIKSAVKSAKSAAGGVTGGSFSNVSAPEPTFAGAPSMLTPQINTVGGQNPTQQIAQTIGAAQKPIEAYVVSQKISSQQALDRRTNVAATFG